MNWNDLFKNKENRWLEPAQLVLDSIELFKNEGVQNILDLGCGCGRNIIPYLKTGFTVSACDISEVAITSAKSYVLEVCPTYEVLFEKCCMTQLLFKDNSFDAVVSISVINHGLKHDVLKAISEINRVLKHDGFLLLTVISKEHITYGSGQLVENDTYITDKGLDAGIPHHFMDELILENYLTQSGFYIEVMKKCGIKEIGGINNGHLYVLAKKNSICL